MSPQDQKMIDDFWNDLVSLSIQIVKKEPALEALMNKLVLTCRSFDQCLARIISSKLASYEVDRQQLFQICMQAYADNPNLLCDAIADVYAVVNRDPASSSIVRVLLFLKDPAAADFRS